MVSRAAINRITKHFANEKKRSPVRPRTNDPKTTFTSFKQGTSSVNHQRYPRRPENVFASWFMQTKESMPGPAAPNTQILRDDQFPILVCVQGLENPVGQFLVL